MTSPDVCSVNATAFIMMSLPGALANLQYVCRVYTSRVLVLLSAQGPFFDEVQLATLAQGLDMREREVMAEAGMETADYLKFVAEDSSNVANDGNFSIQVC